MFGAVSPGPLAGVSLFGPLAGVSLFYRFIVSLSNNRLSLSNCRKSFKYRIIVSLSNDNIETFDTRSCSGSIIHPIRLSRVTAVVEGVCTSTSRKVVVHVCMELSRFHFVF